MPGSFQTRQVIHQILCTHRSPVPQQRELMGETELPPWSTNKATQGSSSTAPAGSSCTCRSRKRSHNTWESFTEHTVHTYINLGVTKKTKTGMPCYPPAHDSPLDTVCDLWLRCCIVIFGVIATDSPSHRLVSFRLPPFLSVPYVATPDAGRKNGWQRSRFCNHIPKK